VELTSITTGEPLFFLGVSSGLWLSLGLIDDWP